jgi:hypothetical protein
MKREWIFPALAWWLMRLRTVRSGVDASVFWIARWGRDGTPPRNLLS